MIRVNFRVLSLDKQISIIESFLTDYNNMSLSIANYFGFDFDEPSTRDVNKMKIIKDKIKTTYNERLKDMKNCCSRFQKIWDEKCKFINNAFVNIFDKEYNYECNAYVNLNPIWPRFLESKSFHVNLDASEDYLIMSSVHEILHFIWFDVWKNNFQSMDKREYDYPNIPWLISEIAVEPLFRFSKLQTLAKTNPAYDYFYTDKIEGKIIVDIANDIYLKSKDINEFQVKLYDYFKNNKETNKLIK